ncbi:hypothetical protein ACIBBG_31425 [Micromonospora chersina]|uniref:hypothetical protein n=1 Tax=Micromonospora chersina TaxID=47854 RepID=UPI00379CB85B
MPHAGTRPLASVLIVLPRLWPAAERLAHSAGALRDAAGRVLIDLIAEQHAA